MALIQQYGVVQYHVTLGNGELGITDSNQVGRRIELLPSLIYLAVCKAGAGSVWLLTTKLTPIALYYMFTHFANILIHIAT